MGTWAAFVGFTQIAETIDGDITAASFYDAASNDVGARPERHGAGARLHQGVDRRPRGLQRLFNRSVVYSQLENGKVVPLTTEFEDVGDLALPAG